MKRIEVCRSCGSSGLRTVLAFGPMPLANALLQAGRLDSPEPRPTLTFAVCARCSLAQVLENVSPEELFRDYVYFSSYSDTMLQHAEDSAAELIALRQLGSQSLVIEVGSNDGYQLKYFKQAGVPVLGIEPARNIAEVAVRDGIPTRVEFFGDALAGELVREGVRADVLLAYNVLAHVPDLNGFVSGIHRVIKPGGVAVFEVPDVSKLLESCEFDTIYHEHLCYFSLSALVPLFARHDLGIYRVDEIPLHGGSLRFYAAHNRRQLPEKSVARVLSMESERGLSDLSAYRGFAERVETLRNELVGQIDALLAEEKTVAAYGAAAKGTTLLNYFGLDSGRIAFAADRSPHKQGLYMPGVHIPIIPAQELARKRPDYCLLLAWNFADEILEQQAAYRAAGGRFIIPLPELRIV